MFVGFSIVCVRKLGKAPGWHQRVGKIKVLRIF